MLQISVMNKLEGKLVILESIRQIFGLIKGTGWVTIFSLLFHIRPKYIYHTITGCMRKNIQVFAYFCGWKDNCHVYIL